MRAPSLRTGLFAISALAVSSCTILLLPDGVPAGTGGAAGAGGAAGTGGAAGIGGSGGAPQKDDGVLVPGEDCDDGNTKAGDGCFKGKAEGVENSSTDEEWGCFGEPSYCRRSCEAQCTMGDRCCGPLGDVPCCLPLLVPGGKFKSAEYEINVAPFYLDRFEVTVARFKKFQEDYYRWRSPEGGGHPKSDGWPEEWLARLPPPSQSGNYLLDCDPQNLPGSFPDDPFNKPPSDCTLGVTGAVPGAALRPVNYVPWVIAAAFCLWDGGRLPTDDEWVYAASGGDEQRLYPWGNTEPKDSGGTSLLGEAASCAPPGSQLPADVGSRLLGRGRWGHDDLAGNVREWTDSYHTHGSSWLNPCIDDATSAADVNLKATFSQLRGIDCGGSSGCALATVGFRCARSLGAP